MKKFGFTLAEVLVSVAIVGVIAALTLPTLRTNTTEAQIGPKLAKAVSTFEQANESLLNSLSSDSLSDAGLTGNTNRYINELSNFLKITPNGEDNGFRTKDNMDFIVEISSGVPDNTSAPAYMQRLGEITININPQTGREISGTNVFYFSFWNDGSLRPKGGTNWDGGSDSELISCTEEELATEGLCTEEGQKKVAKDRKGGYWHWSYDGENHNNCPIGKIPGNPEFCAGHIFENNLKVLYN